MAEQNRFSHGCVSLGEQSQVDSTFWLSGTLARITTFNPFDPLDDENLDSANGATMVPNCLASATETNVLPMSSIIEQRPKCAFPQGVQLIKDQNVTGMS